LTPDAPDQQGGRPSGRIAVRDTPGSRALDEAAAKERLRRGGPYPQLDENGKLVNK
jgi:hypothetical protein